MSLESKHYLASPTDVEAITRSVLEAQTKNSGGRATYLMALIATTQHALGIAPRQRQAPNSGKISRELREKHLAALDAQNEIFYAAVMKAAREILGANIDPIELNRRTNFARSAVSTVRRWIRIGNDITTLVAAKTTKSSLAVAARREKQTSPKVLTNRVRKYGDRFLLTVVKLGESDAKIAREALEDAKATIQQTLDKLDKISRKARSASSLRGSTSAAV
jgi:hypothetical protein